MGRDRLVALWVDRTGLQDRLHRAEDVLYHPELFLFERRLRGREIPVGQKHPLVVKARLILDPGFIHRKGLNRLL